MIEGDYTSLVALSFFDDDIIGMISTAQDGNIMITKTAQEIPSCSIQTKI
jgi:hypothetical protein